MTNVSLDAGSYSATNITVTQTTFTLESDANTYITTTVINGETFYSAFYNMGSDTDYYCFETNIPPQTVVFERSTDMRTWVPVTTNAIGLNTVETFYMDTTAPPGHAFYRLVSGQ